MKNQLRRLRLRQGDIVIVRERDDMLRLITAAQSMKGEIPPCPIVVCEGSIHRLSREYLQKLLERKT